jgi:GNAT superfamily N-acetyltransferase
MITIHRLQREDSLQDLIELSKAFFTEYEGHHPEFFKIERLGDDDIADYLSRTLDSADGVTFVARLQGRTIGYVTAFVRRQSDFYHVKHVGVISGLMVHKDHRRKGIATRLLAESIAFFWEHGIGFFTVYTATANAAALEFYARLGMAPLYTTLIGSTGDRPQGL